MPEPIKVIVRVRPWLPNDGNEPAAVEVGGFHLFVYRYLLVIQFKVHQARFSYKPWRQVLNSGRDVELCGKGFEFDAAFTAAASQTDVFHLCPACRAGAGGRARSAPGLRADGSGQVLQHDRAVRRPGGVLLPVWVPAAGRWTPPPAHCPARGGRRRRRGPRLVPGPGQLP